jgi:hypothetical protein
MLIISFGRFHHLSKDEIEKEKEDFLEKKRRFIANSLCLSYYTPKLEGLKESEIDEVIKEKLSEIKFNKNVKNALRLFLIDFGINYNLLSDDEKKQISSMNWTYENCKIFSWKNYDKFIEKAKEECPSQIYECFDEKLFISYCQICKESEITKRNFLFFIRNYFILDFIDIYKPYRDNELFAKIRGKIIELYPQLKDEYGGRSRIFDKFMSFIEEDNDYNYEIVKEILDNYYNKSQNKYIKLRQKED